MKEGYEQLDLTPGSDRYKSDFANSFDEVHTLTVFPSPGQRWKEDAYRRIRKTVQRGFTRIYLSPNRISSLVNRLKKASPVRVPAGLVESAGKWIGHRHEVRVYSIKATRIPGIDISMPIHRDALDDLLGYEPADTRLPRQRFMSNSLARLKDGQHVYTFVENRRLLHYGWLAERPDDSLLSESHQPFAFPPNSAYLFDFHTIPEARGRGLFTHCLRKMLHDLAQLPETDKIYIMVTADNGPVRHVIEKLGFNHELSLNENVRSSDSGDEPTRVIEPLRRPAGGGLLKNPAFPTDPAADDRVADE